eukprot:comp91594_c0_seq1/m.48572 comp91594_c0_seq1/g.48572  ORF comp91594_c0_seq1/g.48572 comp91594_c0_seq1/m.48572 type:complete len:300 (-) comp91594_c0_seq1:211-1110(-)
MPSENHPEKKDTEVWIVGKVTLTRAVFLCIPLYYISTSFASLPLSPLEPHTTQSSSPSNTTMLTTVALRPTGPLLCALYRPGTANALKTSSSLSLQTLRFCATGAKDPKGELVYTGQLSAVLRRLKLLSITSCTLSLIGTPILYSMQSGISPLGKAIFGTMVMITGVGSTGLIHFFTKPYIHRLWFKLDVAPENTSKTPENTTENTVLEGQTAADGNGESENPVVGTRRRQQLKGELTAETLSIFAKPVMHTFRLDEVQAPSTGRPFVSFQTKKDGKYFFCHKEQLQDPDLAKKLGGNQ